MEERQHRGKEGQGGRTDGREDEWTAIVCNKEKRAMTEARTKGHLRHTKKKEGRKEGQEKKGRHLYMRVQVCQKKEGRYGNEARTFRDE